MNFRWSAGNVVSAAGMIVAVVAGTVIFRKLGAQALDGGSSFLADIPWWLAIAVLVFGVMVVVGGQGMQERASRAHLALMEEYAERNGWELTAPPRWVWESNTFPMLHEDGGSTSLAWQGGYRDHWAVSLLVEADSGAQGAETETTFQVIGLPFNDDMPRLQIMPIDLIEKGRIMVGAKKINFELADFNAAWRVHGENAKRVHDIVHPRTIERLLEPDALGVPVVIDAGAIWTWCAQPVTDDELERRLDVLVDVAEAIPAFVYQDLNVEFLRKETDDVHHDWVTSRRRAGVAQADEYDALDPQD